MNKKHITRALKRKEEERKAMAKYGEKKQVTVDGVKYEMQHTGLRESFRLRERCMNDRGVVSNEALCTEYMEHVLFIVNEDGSLGKTSWDYFEESGKSITKVMKEVSDFLFPKE